MTVLKHSINQSIALLEVQILSLRPVIKQTFTVIGYLFLLTGSVIELWEHNTAVQVASVLPGGLFEIVLSIRLIAKGFNSSAIDNYSEND